MTGSGRRQKVFEYPHWADIAIPTFEEFEEARNAMTHGTNQQPSELAASAVARHSQTEDQCPLLGVKRTRRDSANDVNDPKRA